MLRRILAAIFAGLLGPWSAQAVDVSLSSNKTQVANGESYQITAEYSGAYLLELYKNGQLVRTQASPLQYNGNDNFGNETGYVSYFAMALSANGAVLATSNSAVVVIVNLDETPPAAPTGLQASQITGTSVLLSWTAATDNRAVTGYAVVPSAGNPTATISGTMARVTGLTDGFSYTMQVKARDAAGNWSTLSTGVQVNTLDITAPTTPASPMASAVTQHGCSLSWTASTDNVGVTAYDIRHGGSVVKTVSGSPATISGLVPGRSYNFTIQARDSAGNVSVESASVPVTALTQYGSENILIQNKTYGSETVADPPHYLPVVATNSISANTNVLVGTTAQVRFVAGNRVTLGDGFRATSGTTGTVFIARVGADSTDSDSDGMTDLWELTNGLNPGSNADALADQDGDGLSNIAEYNLAMDAAVANAGAASTGGSLPGHWPIPDGSAFEAVGITSGELSVSPSGAATYSIPIWVSPGTAGMEPKLTLNYSSQAGAGLLGHGWSLGGLSAISRGPQTLAVDGDDFVPGINMTGTDRFYLDGQRLIHVSATYGANNSEYRTEIDSFSRVVSYTGSNVTGIEWFKVWTKAGLIMEFGNTADSRLLTDLPGGGVAVRTWAVNRISDTFGNYMDFVYANDTINGAREHRLSRINYTGHLASPQLNPYASVRIEYEDRLDTSMGYFRGSKYGASKRVAAIKSYYGDDVVRTYRFAYEQRPITYRSMLTSITEIGLNNVELKPLTFEYSESTPGWTSAAGTWALSSSPSQYLLANNVTQRPTGSGFVDFNGDGLTDFFVRNNDTSENAALKNTGSGWQSVTAYHLPWQLVRNDGTDAGGRFADINGDGLVDMIWHHGQETQIGASLNTGQGWTAAGTAWHPPVRVADEGYPWAGGKMMDMNGDGRVDFVSYFYPSGYSNYKLSVFLNTGSGWETEPHEGFGLPPNCNYLLWAKKAQFVELNGDGLPDMVVYFRPNDGAAGHEPSATKGAWLNTGSGWTWAPDYIPHRFIACDEHALVGSEFVDLNGDGLVDQVWSCPFGTPDPGNGVRFNTGLGWATQTYSLAPGSPLAYKVGDEMRSATTMMDINGDGMLDIAHRYVASSGFEYKSVQYGRGTSFMSQTGDADLPAALSLGTVAQKAAGVDMVDLNGDGLTDFVLRRKNDTSTSPTYTTGVWLSTASQCDRLIAVTNGFGVKAEINYKPLTDSTVYVKTPLKPNGEQDLEDIDPGERVNVANVAAGPGLAVSSIEHDDGMGGSYTITYQYGWMRTHRIRGNLGFGLMSVLDNRTNILTTTEFNQNFPFVGSVAGTFTETNGGNGTLLSESVTTYDKQVTTASDDHEIYFPFARESVSKSYDLDGGLTSATRTLTRRTGHPFSDDYDEYGNSKYIEVYSSDTLAAFEDTNAGNDYRKITVNTYTNTTSSTQWWLGRLTSTVVTSSAPGVPTLTRKSGFTYHATAGVLESETVEPDSTDATVKLTTTYSYDAFGNKIGVSVQGLTGSARTTTTVYDSIGRFPTSATNALSHSSSTEYAAPIGNYFGVVTKATDINGLESTFEYDAFGRKVRDNLPDGTYSTLLRRWAYGNAPSLAKYYVQTQSFASNGTPISAPAVEFFDKVGRSIRKLGVNGDGRAVAVDTQYDSMGRAYAQSTAFYADESPAAWTTTLAFDLAGRPLLVQTPDDEVTSGSTATVTLADGSTVQYGIAAYHVATVYRYGSRSVLGAESGAIGTLARITNPKGIVTQNKTNSQGWTTEIIQNFGGQATDVDRTILTKSYDALGQLAQTQTNGEAASNITHVYDVRGRRISTTDPNMGTWTYQYNAFGELTQQTDALSQATTMVYDVLGRLTARNDGVQVRSWTYDTATGKGKGKLHKSEVRNLPLLTFVSSETHAYDSSLGRLVSTTYVINGVTYVTSIDYDAYGRVDHTYYPNSGSGSFTTQNKYNGYGVLKEVRRTDSGLNQVLWMAAPANAYNAAGALEVFILGNGVSTERVISDATGRARGINSGRLQAIGLNPTTQGGFDTQKLIYNYDELGNVDQRFNTNILNPAWDLNETFAYDDLNRVTSQFIVPGGVSQSTWLTVAYDKRGNITNKSDVGSYTYDPVKIHAVKTANGTTYNYNANGNMTSSTDTTARTITWTRFNQIASITGVGGSSSFAFNAENQRITQTSNRGTTTYIGSHYEKFVPAGNPYTEHIHWIMTPAGRVASYKVRSTGYSETQYFHHDGLGSIVAVTNPMGVVSERFYFDAWGRRYEGIPGTQPASLAPVTWASNNSQLTRGFTDHEHLDDLGLIHMNGRVYDPVLGRFLSADPFIDGTDDSQGYNRFSYVGNNPLNHTDPTGYLKFKDVLKIGAAILVGVLTAGATLYAYAALSGNAFGTFAAALNAAINPSFLLGVSEAAAVGFGIGFGSTFAGSLLNGASVGEAFKAGMLGGVAGGIAGGIAYGIGSLYEANSIGFWERASAHGALQGAEAEAMGGEFKHGFIAGFFSASFAPVLQTKFPNDQVWQMIGAAVVGGTASAIGGGKFANAAVGAAWSSLFNEIAHHPDSIRRSRHILMIDFVGGEDASVWEKFIWALGRPYGAKIANSFEEAEAMIFNFVINKQKRGINDVHVMLLAHGAPGRMDFGTHAVGSQVVTTRDFGTGRSGDFFRFLGIWMPRGSTVEFFMCGCGFGVSGAAFYSQVERELNRYRQVNVVFYDRTVKASWFNLTADEEPDPDFAIWDVVNQHTVP